MPSSARLSRQRDPHTLSAVLRSSQNRFLFVKNGKNDSTFACKGCKGPLTPGRVNSTRLPDENEKPHVATHLPRALDTPLTPRHALDARRL